MRNYAIAPMVALVAMFLLLAAAVAQAEGGPQTGKAGKYTVMLASGAQPLAVGENRLTFTVRDGDKPLTGAEVKVHLDMTEMSMPLDVTATPGATAGEYVATAHLAMAGAWKATVSVSQMAGMAMDGDGKADFTLDVPKEAPASAPADPAPSPLPQKKGEDALGIAITVISVLGAIVLAVLAVRKPKSAGQ